MGLKRRGVNAYLVLRDAADGVPQTNDLTLTGKLSALSPVEDLDKSASFSDSGGGLRVGRVRERLS